MTSNTLKFIDKFREVKNLEIIESQSDIKRLSKDFYNYSPILTEKLDECIADLVVRPCDHDAVKEVAEICWEFSIPLTLRGAGTGNYGQAVPLFKGIVMQMNHFNKLEEFDPDTGFSFIVTASKPIRFPGALKNPHLMEPIPPDPPAIKPPMVAVFQVLGSSLNSLPYFSNCLFKSPITQPDCTFTKPVSGSNSSNLLK